MGPRMVNLSECMDPKRYVWGLFSWGLCTHYAQEWSAVAMPGDYSAANCSLWQYIHSTEVLLGE